jgi:hypothetical protein
MQNLCMVKDRRVRIRFFKMNRKKVGIIINSIIVFVITKYVHVIKI